ncbi:MAG: hypothetical protein BWX80_02338 [Candidatus Hydrogenedentes bacterium ADurb.Bin101]|nr:MAG: hypothetical protein BWX80_02338 [Candidatus Hydrogenedentes bacterium ADurb.Bin101]
MTTVNRLDPNQGNIIKGDNPFRFPLAEPQPRIHGNGRHDKVRHITLPFRGHFVQVAIAETGPCNGRTAGAAFTFCLKRKPVHPVRFKRKRPRVPAGGTLGMGCAADVYRTVAFRRIRRPAPLPPGQLPFVRGFGSGLKGRIRKGNRVCPSSSKNIYGRRGHPDENDRMSYEWKVLHDRLSASPCTG